MWEGGHPGAEIQLWCNARRCSLEGAEPFHHYIFTEMTKGAWQVSGEGKGLQSLVE